MKSIRLFRYFIFLSFLLAACAGTVDQSAIQTAAAQTLDADLAAAQANSALQTSEAQNAALQATIDALATQQNEAAVAGTQTAAAEGTLAAVPKQITAPSGAACRSGPNGGFGKVADLAAGVPADALSRSLDGEWWQVASPEGGAPCWVFWSDDLVFTGDVFNLPMVAGPSLPTATFKPTHEPGISARFVEALNCSGTRFAIVRVINLGPETYQSAIVRISDAAGDELRRSDGNNEFLPKAGCPGTEQPTLGPGQERFVTISVSGAISGALIRVTVCTEKGYGGNCWSATTTFVD